MSVGQAPKYKSIRFVAPQVVLPPLCPRTDPHHAPRPDAKMVPAAMPIEANDMENVSLYGFGAIPKTESSATAATADEPMKRRLRPRREKAAVADAADVILVNVRPRRPRRAAVQKTAVAKAKKMSNRKSHTCPTPSPISMGDKESPIEIPDSEGSPQSL